MPGLFDVHVIVLLKIKVVSFSCNQLFFAICRKIITYIIIVRDVPCSMKILREFYFAGFLFCGNNFCGSRSIRKNKNPQNFHATR